MQLDIHRQKVRLDQDLVERLERQMGTALNPFESWIANVAVHLEDINGPKGGVDQQCRVLVKLRSGKTLKIEDVDTDLLVAINRAADRIGQAVGREVDRKRDRKGQ